MKLYYKPGACSLASHIALNEIGADFTLEQVDTETQKTETGADFRQINPNGYVPVLELDDGQRITEGAAILQHLADAHPASNLAPAAGTMARTRLNESLTFTSSELHKAFGPFFAATAPTGDTRVAAEAKLAKKLDHLNAQLEQGQTHLVGKDFTIADSYAFVVSNWANFLGIGLGRWPHVARFVEHIAQRPAVIKAMQSEGLTEPATA